MSAHAWLAEVEARAWDATSRDVQNAVAAQLTGSRWLRGPRRWDEGDE